VCGVWWWWCVAVFNIYFKSIFPNSNIPLLPLPLLFISTFSLSLYLFSLSLLFIFPFLSLYISPSLLLSLSFSLSLSRYIFKSFVLNGDCTYIKWKEGSCLFWHMFGFFFKIWLFLNICEILCISLYNRYNSSYFYKFINNLRKQVRSQKKC